MRDYQKLVDYFKEFIDQVADENKKLIIEAYKRVDENFYTMPAASGSHHNELQACEHGLLYHIYEGLIALEQFIRARSDIMEKFKSFPNYEGTTPESDLITAYLMHDICKFKSTPSGSNFRHDEDGYLFCKQLGFNPVVCDIVRFTHGQWSTAKQTAGATIFECKYGALAWLSHYADMAASTIRPLKFIETVKTFDKTYFSNNRAKKKSGDESIDRSWWEESSNDSNSSEPLFY